MLNFLGSLKMVLKKFRRIHKKTTVSEFFFFFLFDKLKLFRSQAHVFSCEFCKIHKNTFRTPPDDRKKSSIVDV